MGVRFPAGNSILRIDLANLSVFDAYYARADESGAPAIEYGLIAAGISLAIIAVDNGLGTGSKPNSGRSTVR